MQPFTFLTKADMKPDHLFHYLLVIVSVSYNAFAAGNYAAKMIPLFYAYICAILLSTLAHYYLIEGIKHWKKMGTANENLLCAVILCGCCVFADLNGVSILAFKKEFSPVEYQFQKQITSLENAYNTTLSEASSARTIKLRSDLLLLAKQQGKELELKRAEKDQALLNASDIANQSKKAFRIFSILLFILSGAVASLLAPVLSPMAKRVRKLWMKGERKKQELAKELGVNHSALNRLMQEAELI